MRQKNCIIDAHSYFKTVCFETAYISRMDLYSLLLKCVV